MSYAPALLNLALGAWCAWMRLKHTGTVRLIFSIAAVLNVALAIYWVMK